MRIASRIFIVGAIPIAIAAAIAIAAILLLTQANRARSSAILAGTVFRTILTAVTIRNDFLQSSPEDRDRHVAHFFRVAERAKTDLARLGELGRSEDRATVELGHTLDVFIDTMQSLVEVTAHNDALIAGMADRASTLVALSQRLTASAQAQDAGLKSENIAIETLKLSNRASLALVRRDETSARATYIESRDLLDEIIPQAISPPIQAEMIKALNSWREGLITTTDGLQQQNKLLAAMDAAADSMVERARALDTRFSLRAEENGRSVGTILLLGAAAGLLLGGIAAFVTARSITQPLLHLQSRMTQLAADPDAEPVGDTGRRDELGDMARATNRFLKEIARRERALRRARERADAALETLQRTQAELIQVEKLASLGQLVAGIAHEINTPIGVALTTATVIDDETRQFQSATSDGRITRAALGRLVDRVSEGSHLLAANLSRAADLIHSFKHVAADQVSGERRSFELHGWLQQLLTSLGPLLRRAGHVANVESSEGLMLDTYPGALAQVLTNLVVNASLHAFDKGAPGEITVSAAARAGDTVRIVVADDGRGIAADHQTRIFDPFFTTRRAEGSTGLGLHIVFNLVTATLQGHIQVESTPGAGTRFLVDLPRTVRSADEDAHTRSELV